MMCPLKIPRVTAGKLRGCLITFHSRDHAAINVKNNDPRSLTDINA